MLFPTCCYYKHCCPKHSCVCLCVGMWEFLWNMLRRRGIGRSQGHCTLSTVYEGSSWSIAWFYFVRIKVFSLMMGLTWYSVVILICISLIYTEITFSNTLLKLQMVSLSKNWIIFCLLSSSQILDVNSKLVVCIMSIFFFLVYNFFLHCSQLSS